MRPIESLFLERMKHAWKKGGRYAALIAKGLHFLPIFLLISLYFGYKWLLAELPEDFPVSLLLTVLFTWTLSSTRIRTYVQKADPVFLFPDLDGLKGYFRRSLIYSAAMQSLKIWLVTVFLSPLYLTRVGEVAGLGSAWALLTLLKIWNIGIVWLEIHREDRRGVHAFLRWGTNGLITWWLFSGQWFGWPLVIGGIWLGWLTLHHIRFRSPRHLIPWETLMRWEERTVSAYYRLANQFIDVPHIGNDVTPRPVFSLLFRRLPSRPENTYLFLYLRTFFRYREPFGVFVRLTLVTAVLLACLPAAGWFSAFILLTGLYVTGIQLPWIRRIHRYQPWFRLYPLPEKQKRTDCSRLAFWLLGAQSSLALLPQYWAWNSPLPFLLPILLLGWGAAWFLSWIYLPRRLHKRSSLR
ncbi:ABC-2 type transport system permease protein [Melghirimyces profundicolus]|uniref:ABC-2 type transport system permease protein n=1 Tax=Melghirimyces profundicolus TaxID=1242148 RepID=A0A2T6BTH0_9BACL|nr:ABC transporter permease [Melghirimyces profundicolus]PTX59385.1 ABC-2 type transport system permease protein [Melghirimyces profundicolus]